jgi:hypothetical protein
MDSFRIFGKIKKLCFALPSALGASINDSSKSVDEIT